MAPERSSWVTEVPAIVASRAEGYLDTLISMDGKIELVPAAALAGLGAVLFGFSLAWTLYAEAKVDPLPEKFGKLARAMRNRFYFDEIYGGLIASTQEFLAAAAGRVATAYDNVRVVVVGAFCEQPPLGLIKTLEQANIDRGVNRC